MLTIENTVQKNTTWLASDMDGETVMMSIENGEYYALTTVGSSIWNQLDDPISVQTVCLQLQEEYDVSPQQCKEETLSLLNELAQKNMIKVVA